MSDQEASVFGSSTSPQQLKDIETPHDHDVLSGRGNFVNYHPGNEHFRSLVKKHKMEYVACPKPQKSKFSRLIVDEIRRRDPPGRFLKQDNATKLWYDIGDKKALDKTRQALREGAPELLKGLSPSDDEADPEPTPVGNDNHAQDPFAGAGGVSRVNNDGSLHYGAPAVASLHGLRVQAESVHSSRLETVPRLNVSFDQHGRPMPGSTPLPVTLNNLPYQQHRSHPHSSNEHPSMNVAAASQNVQNLQKQLTAKYSGDQFEPTPINPNLAMQIQEAEAQLKALQQQIQTQQLQLQDSQARTQAPTAQPAAHRQPKLERDDSLKFQELFSDSNKEKETQKPSDGHNSSALSAMSFSVGEMTVSEESNLSAVFEDSVRISDAPKAEKVASDAKSDTGRVLPTSIGKPSNLGQSMMMDSFDMSAMTFSPGASTTNFGVSSSGMQMSFSKVFDESSSDFNKKS